MKVFKSPPKPPNPFDCDPFRKCPGGSAFGEIMQLFAAILYIKVREIRRNSQRWYGI